MFDFDVITGPMPNRKPQPDAPVDAPKAGREGVDGRWVPERGDDAGQTARPDGAGSDVPETSLSARRMPVPA